MDHNQISTEEKKKAVLHVLNVRISMLEHFSGEYQRQSFDDPNKIDVLFDALCQPVSSGRLEHFERGVFLAFPTLMDRMNWFDLSHFSSTRFPILNHFADLRNRSIPPGFEPFPSAASMSLTSPTPLQNVSGNGITTDSFNHPNKTRMHLDDISAGILSEWENNKQIQKHAQPVTSTFENPLPSDQVAQIEKQYHLTDFLSEQLEEQEKLALTENEAQEKVDELNRTLRKIVEHRELGLSQWAVDYVDSAKEYYTAIELYSKNLELKEPLSLELAVECSKRRIRELTTENNPNSLSLLRAYAYAIEGITPLLARDINAMMSFQSKKEQFDRLEHYFAQRFEREMLNLN
ncbi:unnamed protein product [Caenorhabditis sp. 36 PRJEB53466]|nr:unnamed protein product [Caenorhabditis sp. 36 PRJEB53466]